MINMSCPKTLLKAVAAGRTRQVRLLLDLGGSTEEQDEFGQTPLIRATLLEHDRNREKILRTLLKRGAQVSKADVVGRNALMWACLYGRDNDVALMIEYADIDLDYNKVDINGQTALFHAVSSGNAATVKLVVSALMKYGLSTDTPDSRGTTPLMQAMRLGHDVCESILIFEGNAKVGLNGSSEFENLNKKEKWAITSLRDRSKVKIKSKMQSQSQFPPIEIQKSSSNNSPYMGSRRLHRSRIKCSDSDDNSMSSDDESFDPLTGYTYRKTKKGQSNDTNHINVPVLNCLQNVPPCKIPPSILASPTASTICNVSSGDESEVDSVASTIIDGKVLKKPVRPAADLNSIYGMKQVQMTSSYRQTAVKTEEPPKELEPANETDTPIDNKKGRKDFEAIKWSKLKRGLRLTGMTKSQQTKPAEHERQDSDQPFSSEGGLPNIFREKKSPSLNKLKSESPTIATKTPRMTATEHDNSRNYSEI